MLLSVLTPSYNYAHFLPDCLDSVANLGSSEVEHVIVDDGSSDQSMSLLSTPSPHVVVESQANRGLAATLNRCLELASGEWVGWLNADDFYLPWVLDALRRAPADVDVIYGDSIFVDEERKFLRLAAQHSFSLGVLKKYGPFIPPPGLFVRRSAMSGIRWDERTIKLMDWDLYLKLAERGARFVYAREPLGAFRRHGAQQSNAVTPPAETYAIRAAHDLPLDARRIRVGRSVGGIHHGVLKLFEGSAMRERKAQRLVGVDAGWWAEGNRSSLDALRSKP